MQFEPATWLQYGVDALDAGYADPYNPVDAIFAAARYLHAAGASTNLRTAILAYNHSEAYASSVLLRAKLISSYPKSVIATLTGLVDARLPVTGKQVAWGPLRVPSVECDRERQGGRSCGEALAPLARQSTGAAAVAAIAAALARQGQARCRLQRPPPLRRPRPAPASAASAAPQFVDLMSAPNAAVVAVADGRILGLGNSRKLGKYVILRDVYGDVFTYAGLGSIAPSYRLPKVPSAARCPAKLAAASAASAGGAASSQPAGAGSGSPLTLHVKRAKPQRTASRTPSRPARPNRCQPRRARCACSPIPATPTRSRPLRALPRPRHVREPVMRLRCAAGRWSPRARCSVTCGCRTRRETVTCASRSSPRATRERSIPVRFSRTGSCSAQRCTRRAQRRRPACSGPPRATCSCSPKSQLELAVLSDPGIGLDVGARHEIASGAIDRRVLAVLAFLSRSGLKPTVSALHRGPACPPPLASTPRAISTPAARWRSPGSTASRSPGTRVLERSPTRRFVRC